MGVELSYKTFGSGQPIVFLHGFCLDSQIWGLLVEHDFDGCQIILVDLPGFGDSPALQADLSLGDLAVQVHEFLQSIVSERPFLFAHSMAGYISLEIMDRYESKYKGLGLVHSHPFIDDATKLETRKKSIDFLENKGVKEFIRASFAGLFAQSWKKKNRQQYNSMVEQYSTLDMQMIKNYQKMMIERRGLDEVLSQLELPIYLQIGGQDKSRDYTTLLAQTSLIERGEVVVLPHCGHMGMIENPQGTYYGILSYLSAFG